MRVNRLKKKTKKKLVVLLFWSAISAPDMYTFLDKSFCFKFTFIIFQDLANQFGKIKTLEVGNIILF